MKQMQFRFKCCVKKRTQAIANAIVSDRQACDPFIQLYSKETQFACQWDQVKPPNPKQLRYSSKILNY